MEDVTSSLNEPLDLFGQNPKLSRVYTQLCFCFSLPNESRQNGDVIVHLQRGLNMLTSNFPWVAGQVVKANNGVFTIVPLEGSPQLHVHDRSNQLPEFNEYQGAGFPFKWLDEKDVAPHRTLPDQRDESAPVLTLQATFINGGVFLTFNAQHNCMDMTGQCEIIRLLAKACNKESYFTSEELEKGNLSREHIIPLADDIPGNLVGGVVKAPGSDLSYSNELEDDTKATWSYFLFSATALSALKLQAQKDVHTKFVSTDDTLCAFVWKHITMARLNRRGDTFTSTLSTFERQVDVRKHLGLPMTYTGNAVYKTSTVQPIEKIVSQEFGLLASELRASLNPDPDLGYRVRQDATRLYHRLRADRVDSRTMTRERLPTTDIKMSSWAKEACYDFDFGGHLGKPQAVRRPSFEAWEGLAYLMPRSRDGEIALAVCLKEEDLRVLQEDETFARFGRYVG